VTPQAENPRRSLGARALAFLGTLLRLANAWVLALGIAGAIDLGRFASIPEIYLHLGDEPQLIQMVTIALMLGWWVAKSPATSRGNDWGEKHPLLTQALVGLTLAALFLAMYWTTTALR
jgi:hypothetical protein